jgi:hypothetical protein
MIQPPRIIQPPRMGSSQKYRSTAIRYEKPAGASPHPNLSVTRIIALWEVDVFVQKFPVNWELVAASDHFIPRNRPPCWTG